VSCPEAPQNELVIFHQLLLQPSQHASASCKHCALQALRFKHTHEEQSAGVQHLKMVAVAAAWLQTATIATLPWMHSCCQCRTQKQADCAMHCRRSIVRAHQAITFLQGLDCLAVTLLLLKSGHVDYMALATATEQVCSQVRLLWQPYGDRRLPHQPCLTCRAAA
jgi:hypothetical protein